MPEEHLRNLGNMKGKFKDGRGDSLEPGAPKTTPADTKDNPGKQYETGSGKPAGAWGGENAGK